MATLVREEPTSAYELERGKPMPSLNHAQAQTQLTFELARFAGTYSILSELSIEINGKPYTPDLSIFEPREINWFDDVVRVTDPPLIAIEILSPTQGFSAISADKLKTYFAHGIGTIWVVHPELQTITIFTSPTSKKTFTEGEVTDPKTPITVNLDRIFGAVGWGS